MSHRPGFVQLTFCPSPYFVPDDTKKNFSPTFFLIIFWPIFCEKIFGTGFIRCWIFSFCKFWLPTFLAQYNGWRSIACWSIFLSLVKLLWKQKSEVFRRDLNFPLLALPLLRETLVYVTYCGLFRILKSASLHTRAERMGSFFCAPSPLRVADFGQEIGFVPASAHFARLVPEIAIEVWSRASFLLSGLLFVSVFKFSP